jgi:protease-4
MREFFKMFFASLLAMVIGGVVILGIFIAGIAAIGVSFSDKVSKKKSGNVIVIDVSKHIHEQGATNSLAMLSDGAGSEAGLYDIMKAITYAKKDDDIKGIYLKLSPSVNGWATSQQLRMALKDFKTSGKFIYAYGENISQGAYFLASVADSIYLNPAGGLELKGFATVMPFFKGTLEKLELQPEIYYAGKFKSATEPFRADKISDPNRLQIETYQGGLWNEFLSAVSEYTHTENTAVNQLALNGTIQFPSDALKNKMVAGLLYWDEVEARMKAKTGKKESEDIKYISINDYSSSHKNEGKYSSKRVAVLIAEGDIVDGEEEGEHQIASKTFCDAIRKVAKDTNIKAVVLRVNSPGGSALASEVILRELMLLKKKKHVVVSMGDYAASGGYYISMAADSIFALPNTITGSIGVFGMMFSMDKLAKNKLGIVFDEVKNAPYADLPTTTRPLTAEEGRRMQTEIDTIYSLFTNHVAVGRHLPVADVDSIAQGRVWTGTDAKRIGLVDALGGLDKAIVCAAGMANLKDYKVVTYPEPTDKLNAMLKKLGLNSSGSAGVKAAIKQEVGEQEYGWYEKIQGLRKINGKAMMAMPFVPVVQ